MTTNAVLRRLYSFYDSGYRRPNLLFWLHRKVIQSPFVTRMLFGVNVDRAFMKNGFFDLTSILLKWDLGSRIRKLKEPRLLEIGVGRFAVLSGSLSHRINRKIIASDYDPIAVESSRVHVHRNGLDIEILQSDVLESVPAGKFNLIFWNLPYYDDPEPILSRLFSSADDYLTDDGTLILGFNGKPLAVSRVLEILGRSPALEVQSLRSYWWNLHALVAIQKVRE